MLVGMKVKIITSTHDYGYYAWIIYKSIENSSWILVTTIYSYNIIIMIIYEISISFSGIDEENTNISCTLILIWKSTAQIMWEKMKQIIFNLSLIGKQQHSWICRWLIVETHASRVESFLFIKSSIIFTTEIKYW